jgi:hypothetical protein
MNDVALQDGIGRTLQSQRRIVHQPCRKRCRECKAKISTRQIRGLMTRSPWRMFARYVKGGWDRSASAVGDSYAPHALEGRSISVMRSENEKQRRSSVRLAFLVSFVSFQNLVRAETRMVHPLPMSQQRSNKREGPLPATPKRARNALKCGYIEGCSPRGHSRLGMCTRLDCAATVFFTM